MYKKLLLLLTLALLVAGCTTPQVDDASQDTSQENENINIVSNENTNTVVNENTNTVPEEVEEETESALDELQSSGSKARDVARLADITTIQVALELYKAAQGSYPTNLDELVNQEYLNAVPENPTPGGQTYTYTPIGSLPAQYYDLCYELEEGTDQEEAGYHCVSP